jgi:hypothetical protein
LHARPAQPPPETPSGRDRHAGTRGALCSVEVPTDPMPEEHTMTTTTIYTILHEEHVATHKDLVALQSANGAVRKELLEKIRRELSAHAIAEDQVLYARLQQTGESEKDTAFEAREEHALVMAMLQDLNTIRLDDERFRAKVKVLTELVEHHVEEEEGQLFKEAQAKFDDTIAQNFAGEFVAARDALLARPTLLRLGQDKLRMVAEDVKHLIQPQPT